MAKKVTRKKKAKKTKATRTKKKRSPAKKEKAKATKPRKAAKPARKTKAKAPRTKKAPSGLGIQTQHVDFLTYKIDQVRKFYDQILDLKTDTRDAEGLNYLVVSTSSNSSLGFMPPHPEMRGDQPLPREPTLYFLVKDLDRAYAQLLAKGVAFMGPPQEMPWGHRIVTTTDPEGRTIMLAESPRKKR